MNLATNNVLSIFATTKETRQQFAQVVIDEMKLGIADPMKIHLQVKCMEDFIKQITSHPDYKDLTLDEAAKYGKSFEMHNAKFEVKEMGVKYDFTQCGDPIYNKLAEELAELEKQFKDRQAFLKTVQPGTQLLIEDEVVTLYPPIKTSTTSITVNLK